MPGPGPSAHQVLVYSGPGVSPVSLSHTLLTLSLQLVPYYTVQPVNESVLAKEPWEPSCAMLVIPGGRDLPFVEELTQRSDVTKRIKAYVQEGGRYLGICAGAYFASSEVRFDVGGDKEVVGKRDLDLFPGPCVGPAYNGFDYGSESGSRAVSVHLEGKSRALDLLYYNGGGSFSLPSPNPSGVEVAARYGDMPASGLDVAAVEISLGKGKAFLSAVHFEYPLQDPPARDAISKLDVQPDEEVVEESEKDRKEWVSDILVGLGLRVPSREEKNSKLDGQLSDLKGEEDPHLLLHPTHPSPIFALSHPKLPEVGKSIFAASSIRSKIVKTEGEWETVRDGNDEIEIGSVDLVKPTVAANLAKRRRTPPEFPPTIEKLSLSDKPTPAQPPNFHALLKTVLLPGAVPYSPAWTPLFNMETYWSELDTARERIGRRTGVLRKDETDKSGKLKRPAIGDVVLYAETVTSTQTMIDRNPGLLNGLPYPTAFLASFQLSGRGRGSNLWLSPAGCLQFSLLLSLPPSMANKLIFVQYLAALAIAEALDEDGRLGVRIKWPNDIYANVEGVGGTEVGSGKKGLAKIGGILVNTNYVNGQWRVIVGCGINVLNALPTTSVSQLHSLLADRAAQTGSRTKLPPPPTMERSFARILTSFEAKWEQFLEEGGFHPFMNEYHSRWLHSGQEVTLTTVEPHQRLRIMSITPDQGLLRGILLDAPQVSRTGLSPLYGNRNVDSGSEDRTAYSAYRGVGGLGLGGRGPTHSAVPQYVDLQPDGNSFDLMAGLIKKKV